jgi:lipoprotein-anchoring transpeptidase ErfK/SrfK
MIFPNRRSRRAAVAALIAAGPLVLSGCTTKAANADSAGSAVPTGAAPLSSDSPAPAPSPTVGPGTLAIVPVANAKNVAPGTGVRVTAAGAAAVTSVTVKAGPSAVAGTLSTDGHTWTSTGKLAFGTKYTVTVATTGLASGAASTTSTFTTASAFRTVTPALWTNSYIQSVTNGGTYGVGQPAIVHFNRSIASSSRAAVVKALHVDATPAVEGRWHWISATEVHYRPEKYWATGTTITISADLYGVKIASGTYGASSETRTIHIGESHVAIADNKTHQMKLYINGKLTKTIPISMGRGGIIDGGEGNKINLWTRNGPHVVINKTPFTMMSSGSYGLVDKSSPLYYPPSKILWTVRVSYTGEFVHLRTWTTGDLGHRNTSHGCINVGDGNAQYLYKLFIPGDIVDVTGTPTELPINDGLGDWTIPWSKW